MNYLKGIFCSLLFLAVIFNCLIALGFLILLIQDYWSYKALGENFTDTLSITGLCGMNAIVYALVIGLFKA